MICVWLAYGRRMALRMTLGSGVVCGARTEKRTLKRVRCFGEMTWGRGPGYMPC